MGAAEVLTGNLRERYKAVAERTHAGLLQPLLGPPVLTGGVDATLECVGAAASINDALRLTRAGGRVILVGLAAVPRGVDWTPIWLREVAVHGTAYYAEEQVDGRVVRSIDVAMDLLARGVVDLARLVTHRFSLSRYREAIAVASDKRRALSVKVVMRPQ